VKYDDISPTMRAFLGGREGFRKLGFRAEDLYCALHMSVRFRVLSCFVKLMAQDKEFNLEVGSVEDADEFQEEYKRVAVAINAGELPESDQDRIWQESEAHTNAFAFVMALRNKGFRIPNVGN